MRKSVGRALAVVLVAIATILSSQTAAFAWYTQSIPAKSPGGIGETMVFNATMPTEPYAPSATDITGPYTCILLYHEYFATPGCGGFSVDLAFSNVRTQPAYLAGIPDNTFFHAYADMSRTFGCTAADGVFDWNTAFVVHTDHTELSPVYVTAQAAYLIYEAHYLSGDLGPSFYVNFPPVAFTCPSGETRTQFGLEVTKLSISISGSPVFGTRTWKQTGAFYG
jgi:hypothetical protein